MIIEATDKLKFYAGVNGDMLEGCDEDCGTLSLIQNAYMTFGCTFSYVGLLELCGLPTIKSDISFDCLPNIGLLGRILAVVHSIYNLIWSSI